MFEASAPGKLILCGEHAVVYGRPAIAVPVADVQARVAVRAGAAGGGVLIDAPDLGWSWLTADAPDDPLSILAEGVLARIGIAGASLRITIRSAIPVASGMGSGAAIAAAMVRAIVGHYGHALPPDTVSSLVFESERRYHGTPSGIDNTVVAYGSPVWFERRGTPEAPEPPLIEPVAIAQPLTLVIGDTGVRSATRLPVGDLRRRWQEDPARYEALFDQVGGVVRAVREGLAGDAAELGALLDANHALLYELGVSSPELERLVTAARSAGAAGAKLSGAGWGGVMLALVEPELAGEVSAALGAAGAERVLVTQLAAQAGGQAGA